MNEDEIYQKQLEREDECETAAYNEFIEQVDYNEKIGNASSTVFANVVTSNLLSDIVKLVEKRTSQYVGARQSEISKVLERCLIAKPDGKTVDYFDCDKAAFIGIQQVMCNALNPNQIDDTDYSKHGREKRFFAKKSLTELEQRVGEIIHSQMSLMFIQKTFPAWFRKAYENADSPVEGGEKSTPYYFEYRMKKAMRDYQNYLMDKGDVERAELFAQRKRWTHYEERIIGGLIISSVLGVCSEIFKTVNVNKATKSGKSRTQKFVELTEYGTKHKEQMTAFVAKYEHYKIPMLMMPNPITNETLGGWYNETLQEKREDNAGSIKLSDQHLEFINRQARVEFEVNPFIYELLEELTNTNCSLGKFIVDKPLDRIPTVAELCGLGSLGYKTPEQNAALRKHPLKKEMTKKLAELHSRNGTIEKKAPLAKHLLAMAKKVKDDEKFFYPMDYCFRGRIYSRVCFLSFQSTDAGRYCIRFKEKTPIDNRTEHWLKVGIANAGGQDKVCWDDRIKWFDNNIKEIINVGKMLSGGNFDAAINFLDKADDPFCLAALANEYVKVFIDKTQDYTQCYVFVDCSCSGTSIFNAWRRNAHGARMTNVLDTTEPADIYMEVWYEIQRLAPEGTFRQSHIKKLEKSKLIRKMMKTTYVPASYAQTNFAQLKHLRNFNKKELKEKSLHFKEHELETLCSLWEPALDKVSSIKSVMNWFHARTKEIVDSGATSIKYTTSNGSVMTLKYPKQTTKKVNLIRHGSARYHQGKERVNLEKIDTKKMLSAITANITHATDAAALCSALWNCEHSFAALHDACGIPPGKKLDEGIRRLKKGFIEACRHSVWDTFRKDNNLPLTPVTAPPIIGDMDEDLEDIIHSSYLYS